MLLLVEINVIRVRVSRPPWAATHLPTHLGQGGAADQGPAPGCGPPPCFLDKVLESQLLLPVLKRRIEASERMFQEERSIQPSSPPPQALRGEEVTAKARVLEFNREEMKLQVLASLSLIFSF